MSTENVAPGAPAAKSTETLWQRALHHIASDRGLLELALEVAKLVDAADRAPAGKRGAERRADAWTAVARLTRAYVAVRLTRTSLRDGMARIEVPLPDTMAELAQAARDRIDPRGAIVIPLWAARELRDSCSAAAWPSRVKVEA